MSRSVRSLLILILASPLILAAVAGNAAQSERLQLSEFTIDKDALCQIRDQWIDQTLDTYPQGTWAPMKMELTDAQLDLMGLPSSEVLQSRSYPRPTIVAKDGRFQEIPMNEFNASMGAAMDPAVRASPGPGASGSVRALCTSSSTAARSPCAAWPTCTARPSAPRDTARTPARRRR